ncbi:MAG: hemerythrin family protein [Rhodocyclales bacterium]|nr:hemerythrin family protein [Rhodocyclales bacterium]
MKWKNEYSLGIQEIDDQHRLLLSSFSVIEEAIKLKQGWSNVHYSIIGLKELARMHFTFEEALMRLFAYPEAKEHRSDHEYFFVRLAAIENNSLRNSTENELLEFLREWLTIHILQTDMGYARHILSGASVVRSAPPPLKQDLSN